MAAGQALEAERDAIVAALTSVVDGLVATFGPMCEVVLHDYRRPDESVVAVAGSVTGRAVGGAMSEIGMRIVARGDGAGDDLNYVTRTRAGKLVKASTMVLRDSTGAVFGALCVNLDVTAVNEAHALLGALAGVGAAPAAVPVTAFGNDIDSVVDAILDAHQLRQNASWAGLDRAQRLELFRSLDERGVFAVRRAIEQVAERLGISRASAYSYLSQARAVEVGDEAGEGGRRRAAGGDSAVAGPRSRGGGTSSDERLDKATSDNTPNSAAPGASPSAGASDAEASPSAHRAAGSLAVPRTTAPTSGSGAAPRTPGSVTAPRTAPPRPATDPTPPGGPA